MPMRFQFPTSHFQLPRWLSVFICFHLWFIFPAGAARLFTTGWEEGSSSNYSATIWNNNPTVTVSNTWVHSGSYAFRSWGSARGAFTRYLTSNKTSGTLWTRFYLYSIDMPDSADLEMFRWSNSTPASANAVFLQTDGKLRLVNSVTSTTQTSTALSTSTCYRLELEYVIADSGGSLTLRIYTPCNATSPSQTLTISSEDTLNTNVSRFYIGNVPGSSIGTYDVWFDDLALNDEAGSFQNSWPGYGKVAFIKPGGDVSIGFTKTGANCSGTTNTDCVDDLPGTPDDDSGYNEVTGGTEATDQFSVTSLPSEVPSDADIILVHVVGRARGTSTVSTNTARLKLWDEASTLTDGPTTSFFCDNTAYPAASTNAQLDTWLLFDASTRTKANINSFNLGYETVSLAQTCRFTFVWASVEWKEAPSGVARRRVMVTP
jgi:hypothetical protein